MRGSACGIPSPIRVSDKRSIFVTFVSKVSTESLDTPKKEIWFYVTVHNKISLRPSHSTALDVLHHQLGKGLAKLMEWQLMIIRV